MAEAQAAVAVLQTQVAQGKVAAARFFARTVLPELAARRAVAADVDLDLMDLDEAAF